MTCLRARQRQVDGFHSKAGDEEGFGQWARLKLLTPIAGPVPSVDEPNGSYTGGFGGNSIQNSKGDKPLPTLVKWIGIEVVTKNIKCS